MSFSDIYDIANITDYSTGPAASALGKVIRDPVTNYCTLLADKDMQMDIYLQRRRRKEMLGRPRNFYHRHDFFELIYVPEGTCYHQILGRELAQDQTCLLLLNPNIYHGNDVKDTQTYCYNILISKALVEQHLLTLLSRQEKLCRFLCNSLYDPGNVKGYLLFAANDTIIFLLQRMITIFYDPDAKETHIQELIGYLLILLNELARTLMEEDAPAAGSPVTARILEVVSQEYATLTLQELAQRLNYSTGYLGQYIQRHMGKSFSALIYDQRLKNAEYYLSHTNLPINGICTILGFQSDSALYKMFMKEHHVSPLQYRKTKGQGAEHS